MVKGDRDIPVSPNLVPPSGCPRHGITSIEQCSSRTNSSVCLQFCPKTRGDRQANVENRSYRERLTEMPTPTTALDALALLMTATAADLEEGKITTEEAQKLWRGMGINKDLKDSQEA